MTTPSAGETGEKGTLIYCLQEECKLVNPSEGKFGDG